MSFYIIKIKGVYFIYFLGYEKIYYRVSGMV